MKDYFCTLQGLAESFILEEDWTLKTKEFARYPANAGYKEHEEEPI